jgi:histidine triad (HIT) family protein
MSGYDSNNIFAKILRGEIPCHKVYEDDHALAFMDIMPQAEGHTLIVPKAPSRNLLDAHPAVLSAVAPIVQKLARAAKRAFDSEGVLIMQFNEPAAGQTVFHLHFHVIPRKEGTTLRPHTGQTADHDVLAKHAELLRQALDRLP